MFTNETKKTKTSPLCSVHSYLGFDKEIFHNCFENRSVLAKQYTRFCMKSKPPAIQINRYLVCIIVLIDVSVAKSTFYGCGFSYRNHQFIIIKVNTHLNIHAQHLCVCASI